MNYIYYSAHESYISLLWKWYTVVIKGIGSEIKMSVFKYQLLDKLLNVFKPVILPEKKMKIIIRSLSLSESCFEFYIK